MAAVVIVLLQACAVTVLFEATAQLGADTVAPPLTVTPVPLLLSAMIQPGALALSSAWEVALTDRVGLVVSTAARSKGSLVVT